MNDDDHQDTKCPDCGDLLMVHSLLKQWYCRNCEKVAHYD